MYPLLKGSAVGCKFWINQKIVSTHGNNKSSSNELTNIRPCLGVGRARPPSRQFLVWVLFVPVSIWQTAHDNLFQRNPLRSEGNGNCSGIGSCWLCKQYPRLKEASRHVQVRSSVHRAILHCRCVACPGLRNQNTIYWDLPHFKRSFLSWNAWTRLVWKAMVKLNAQQVRTCWYFEDMARHGHLAFRRRLIDVVLVILVPSTSFLWITICCPDLHKKRKLYLWDALVLRKPETQGFSSFHLFASRTSSPFSWRTWRAKSDACEYLRLDRWRKGLFGSKSWAVCFGDAY